MKIAYISVVVSLLLAAPALAEQGEQAHMNVIQKMDKDSSGTVSEQEFQQATKKEFESVDQNKNSMLERNEQQQLADRWSERQPGSSASQSSTSQSPTRSRGALQDEPLEEQESVK